MVPQLLLPSLALELTEKVTLVQTSFALTIGIYLGLGTLEYIQPFWYVDVWSLGQIP